MGIIGETIISKLGELLSEEISNQGLKVLTRIRLAKWKSNLKRWVNEYTIKRDGTILTEGRFLNYINYHNPIEEIYRFACKSDLRSNELFINELIEKTKGSIEKGLDVNDELELKHFYGQILEKTFAMRQEFLSDNEKTMIRRIDQSENRVVEMVREETADIAKQIANIHAGELSEAESIELFKDLNIRFWNCEFDELAKICSAIEGKSKDLVLWIKLTLSLFLYESPYKINQSEYLNIHCAEIRDDIVRKMFVLACFEKKAKTFEAVPYSEDLKKIINEVSNDNYSSLYSETHEKKGNLLCVGIKVNNSFNDEKWFLRDVMLLYLFTLPYWGVSKTMKELLEKGADFLTDLVYFRQLLSEDISDKCDERDDLFSKLKAKKNSYCRMTPSICAMYYDSLLICAMQKDDKEALCKLLNDIPEHVCSHDFVADSVQSAQIELGTANYDEIVARCKRTGKNWLLHEYYMSFESPMKVVDLIAQHQEQVLNDILTFVDYVRALHFVGDYKKRDSFLEAYKDQYTEYFEYWTTRIELLKNPADVDYFEQKWKTGNIKCLIAKADVVAAEIFYRWKRYATCIEAVTNCEEKGLTDSNVEQYKISSLFQLGKKIEAHSELVNLYTKGNRSPFVVTNLLALTIELNRQVPSGLIDYVRNQRDPIALALSAQISEREGLKEEAKEWYRKALILSDGLDVKICGSYWGFMVQNAEESRRDVKCVDIDTALLMKNADNGEVKQICVCDKKYLPDDYYLWNGIIHLSVDEAVKYCLFRKRQSDVIIFEGTQYKIEEIVPIEVFYDRYCLGKMIETNSVKTLSGPLSNDKEVNVENLTNWIKESIGDSDESELLKDYEDFDKMPLPLFALSRNTPISYAHLIKYIIESKEIIIRESFDFNTEETCEESSGFVLSFSVIVLCFLLGISAEKLRNNKVFLPRSAYIEAKKENERTKTDNNRENVAYMGIMGGKLSITQIEEGEKTSRMKFAVDLLNYCNKIPQIDNDKGISIDAIPEANAMSMYGVVDYDAITICKTKGLTLVSIEQFITELARMPGVDVKSISPLTFLNTLPLNFIERLAIAKMMVGFRMINVLNAATLEEVSKLKSDVDNESLKCWCDYLDEIDKSRGKYREIIKMEFTMLARRTLGESSEVFSPGIRIFMGLTMKLNSLKFAHRINEKGELLVGVIQEAYEDVT